MEVETKTMEKVGDNYDYEREPSLVDVWRITQGLGVLGGLLEDMDLILENGLGPEENFRLQGKIQSARQLIRKLRGGRSD